MYEGELPAEIEEPHTGASEEIETPDGALSVAAMRSLLDLLHEERWDVYSQWMQLKFALKTSGAGTPTETCSSSSHARARSSTSARSNASGTRCRTPTDGPQ